jgi:outer membrane protein assembly factor BamB
MRTAILVAMAGTCTACRAPTEITLELTTDVPCASLSDVAITVGASATEVEGSASTVVTSQCDPATGRIGSLVLVPSGGTDDAVAIRVTARVLQAGDPATGPCVAPYGPSCIVARRWLRYLPHTPVTLPVPLARSCAGLPCAPDETCDRGVCRSTEQCGEAGCETPDGGSPPVVVQGCGDMRGLQAGAQWPMLGYCPARIGRSPFHGPHGPLPVVSSIALNHGPLTSPVIDAAGMIYVAGDTALVALGPDLSLQWTQTINGPTENGQTDTSPVLAQDGTVWVGSATHQLWAVTPGEARPYAVDFFFGTPVIDPAGTLIFPTGAGETLRGVSPDGATVFDVPVATPPALHSVPARGWDGSVFVGTVGQLLVTVQPPAHYETSDLGPPINDFEPPLVHPSGLVLAEVGGADHMQLAAFDAKGKFVWKVELPGGNNLSNGAAVGPEGEVLASTAQGLAVVDVGAQALVRGLDFGDPNASTRLPTVGADGIVYVTKGASLYAVDPSADTNPIFTIPAESVSPFESSPAIGKNGWLYVTSTEGFVYAIHDP